VTSMGRVDEEIFAALEQRLRERFGFETQRSAPLSEPADAYDPQRRQYSSVILLRHAVERCPGDAAKFLVVTDKDMFIPMLSFVYGQAQLGGKAALVSLAQLRQEFYGLPAEASVLRERVVKEALHELGHAFGLIHCVDRGCPMALSTNIRQIDLKGSEFCEGCRALLHESMAAGADGPSVLELEEQR